MPSPSTRQEAIEWLQRVIAELNNSSTTMDSLSVRSMANGRRVVVIEYEVMLVMGQEG